MASGYGRNVTFVWNSVTYKAREKSISVNGEPSNITDDGDSGWQTLLDADAEKSVNIELSGIYKVPTLRESKINGTVQAAGTLTYTDEGKTITGTFNLANYSEGAPYNEAITYTASFMSSGVVTAGTV
jgi:predicted secreted protein